MQQDKITGFKILPVMFGFFIMGFVGIIGIAINYVKQDFLFLSNTLGNLLAMSCFFWFLVLSIPTGMLMYRIGRKKTVLLSFVMQVALNPLVTDVEFNTTFPKLLMEKCGLPLNEAGLGNSVYFLARTLGALGDGIFLLRYAETKFFRYSLLLALIGLVGMFVTGNL